MSTDSLPDSSRSSADDRSSYHENVAEEDESSAAEEITVGSKDHESDCSTDAVDGRQPGAHTGCTAERNRHLTLDRAEERNRPE